MSYSSIPSSVEMRSRIFWDSSLSFGQGGLRAQTAQKAYASTNNPRMAARTKADLTIYSIFGATLDNAGMGVGKAYEDMLKDALPQVEHSKKIRAADYYDYYPVSIYIIPEEGDSKTVKSLSLEEENLDLIPEEKRSADVAELAKIVDYFRVPVLEDQYLLISGNKDKNGNINKMSFGADPDESGDNYYLQSNSIEAQDGFYFYFYGYSEKNKLMDFSHVPGGYGLYFLPFSENADGARGFDADGLKTVLPLDPDNYIYYLCADADGHLIMVTCEDGGLYAAVIETENYTQTQKIRLADYEKDSEGIILDFCSGDDYLYVCRMENVHDAAADAVQQKDAGFHFILLAENAQGEYELAIDNILSTSELPEGMDANSNILPWNEWSSSKQLAWNGEKLAVASTSRLENAIMDVEYDWVYDIRNYYYDQGCGFDLAIIGTDGLEYLGVCSSTLDQANLYAVPKKADGSPSMKTNTFRTYNYNVRPHGETPVQLSWR